jgi:hypothetical protein
LSQPIYYSRIKGFIIDNGSSSYEARLLRGGVIFGMDNQSNEEIVVRRATEGDADSILRVHHDAVHIKELKKTKGDYAV